MKLAWWCLAALVSLVISGPLAAEPQSEELWSISGSFNDWSTDDPDWVMNSLNPAVRTYTLERYLEPGEYEFKFVRTGARELGELGALDASGRLADPGVEIDLVINHPATYTIFLNASQQNWMHVVTSADEIVIDIEMLGVPTAFGSFAIDFGKSIVPGGADRASLMFRSNWKSLQAMPRDPRSTMQWFRAVAEGPTEIHLELQHQGETTTQVLPIHIGPELSLRYRELNSFERPIEVLFEHQGGDHLRALVHFHRDMTLGFFALVIGEDSDLRWSTTPVEAGTYAIDLHDFQLSNDNPRVLNDLLDRGGWRRFRWDPTFPVRTVHVSGDFNDWAAPGEPGSIELVRQADGVYSRIVDVPAGRQRYQLIVNGRFPVLDQLNRQTATKDDGTVVNVLE